MPIVHNTCGSEAAQLWLTTDIHAGCSHMYWDWKHSLPPDRWGRVDPAETGEQSGFRPHILDGTEGALNLVVTSMTNARM